MNLVRLYLAAWARRATLVWVALLIPLCADAQQKELRNAVGVCSTSLQFEPHNQYLGIGIDYRFMYRPWLGAEMQGSESFNNQVGASSEVGYAEGEINGSILAGHRWGKVGVFAEAGYGATGVRVHGGVVNGQDVSVVRTYPSFLAGGLVEVSLARRWSLTYEARDYYTFIGPYREQGQGQNVPLSPAENINIPEGRIGVAFHF